jgi:hypothetical protein
MFVLYLVEILWTWGKWKAFSEHNELQEMLRQWQGTFGCWRGGTSRLQDTFRFWEGFRKLQDTLWHLQDGKNFGFFSVSPIVTSWFVIVVCWSFSTTAFAVQMSCRDSADTLCELFIPQFLSHTAICWHWSRELPESFLSTRVFIQRGDNSIGEYREELGEEFMAPLSLVRELQLETSFRQGELPTTLQSLLLENRLSESFS